MNRVLEAVIFIDFENSWW